MYLKNKFPRISDAKIKKEVFIGRQITEVTEGVKSEDQLCEEEISSMEIIKKCHYHFWGANHKAVNYSDMVADLVQLYKVAACNMSSKVRFSDPSLDFFPENLWTVSDEQGQRFHQDISTMEKLGQGKWGPSMFAEYCWTLRRDVLQVKYSSKSSSCTFKVLIHTLQHNVNTGFLQISTARHLKTAPYRKENLKTCLNSAQKKKIQLVLGALVRVAKNKTYSAIRFICALGALKCAIICAVGDGA